MSGSGSWDCNAMLRKHSRPLEFRRTSAGHDGDKEEEPTPYGSHESMALFMISIPLMVLAVALAALPLILVSHADHRRRTAETTSRSHGAPSEPIAAVDTEPVPLAA